MIEKRKFPYSILCQRDNIVLNMQGSGRMADMRSRLVPWKDANKVERALDEMELSILDGMKPDLFDSGRPIL